jgi:hypothetical protein
MRSYYGGHRRIQCLEDDGPDIVAVQRGVRPAIFHPGDVGIRVIEPITRLI